MTHDAIRGLHHREFERLTARLLARDGFTIEQAFGGSGDLGADVIALSPRSGRRFVVQCKHTSGDGKVGTPDLQRFKGTVWDVHRADVALMVTNGSFSRKAAVFAQEHNITLLGKREIERWAGAGDALWDLRPLPAFDQAW
ncbi:restriction endonuclease [Streptomyces kaniharaensis]|uniref:Restriction endonuclease n=2 Tax=Streptomyces kaniharaensis TaxID=212423 RepID=A0A6N7L4I4_9ACTN|nr:restriction endonuclease [Streptomyces kaniharaensis]